MNFHLHPFLVTLRCFVNVEKTEFFKRIMLTWLIKTLLFVKYCQFHSAVRQI